LTKPPTTHDVHDIHENTLIKRIEKVEADIRKIF